MHSSQSSDSSPPDSIAAEAETQKQQEAPNELFPIVGIVASAGGLEAFTQLLSHLPINTGMGFVLIQHLAPNQKSLLTEILAKTTQMPVEQVQNGVSVQQNHVYIIPPNTKMMLAQGVLQLMPREKIDGKYMPGDVFFTSLAAELGSKAISVVLSGSDGDGARGSEAIKVAGGITFAQCESSAQFSDMPNTAIATGNVDFILPPPKIAEELAHIARHPNLTRAISSETVELPESQNLLPAIFAMLSTATGVDFSHYKQTTLNRRIDRRMVLYKLERLEDYVQYLQENPDEVQALYHEILISVTNFFRDPEAYQALKERVFPAIAKGKSVDLPIRIWVSGCATGEEVYSIAICLMEFLEDVIPKPAIQIFATDINETAIEKARLAIYKPNQIVDISPERLRRFFNQVESGYQICKLIRELCIFARQNLISDPPFSNLDLVSCRNVLIYLEAVLQKQIMPIFHYSLKPTGFLMLGIAESAGEFSNLFTSTDRKHNIYAKKLISTPLNFNFGISNYPVAKVTADKLMSSKTWDIVDLNQQADQIVLNRYAPVGVMINDSMDILQFRGETSPYLRPAPGTPSFNLFKMARKGLLEELRSAILQAKRQDISVRKSGIQIEGSDPSRKVNIEVIPFQADSAEARCFLVLFENVPALKIPQAPITSGNVDQPVTETEILQLQQELTASKQDLAATQEYLQVISQEHEATTQHLKVANEEILSSNEELQSTNEELQTAKEEIQASNEELHISNQELHSRNVELHQVNNDLLNLFSSVNIPILILTNELRIRRFTPTAQRLFNLIPTDVGRLLSNIRSTLDVPDLESLLIEVIDTLSIKELEVQDTAGHWYNLRIRPYRTTENQIDGVVMVLMDIDALKRSTKQMQEALDYAEAVVETVPEPLIVLNSELRVIKSNRAFYETFQVTPAQTEHQLIFELGNCQWNIPELRSLLEEILPQNIQVQDFELCCVFEKSVRKTILLNAYKILLEGNQQMILLALHDITQQKEFAVERAQLLAQEHSARLEAEASNRTKDEFLSVLSHELRNPLHAILGWSQLLQEEKLDPAQINRAIDLIRRSAKAQSQMIEEILDISRITTGKLRLNNRPIDLAYVIEAALEVVQLSAKAKNIQIESQLEPGIQVLGDADRLQQVMWNLLSNAIKFTPDGGCVNVKLKKTDSQVQIRVSDTGIGIPNDFLPYVFERFRQADSSKTRTNQGLGLGLSLVRHLVELHGGTVQAESPGEELGTTIIVTLPVNSNLEQSLLAAHAEMRDLDEPTLSVDKIPSLEGLHILVVDDDAEIRELMKILLETYGAKVTAIGSADEAFSILTSQPGIYNLLLSDIGMSNQDGYTLIRRVRSLSPEAGGQIPAAALTGYIGSNDIQESRKAGFQMHIPKLRSCT